MDPPLQHIQDFYAEIHRLMHIDESTPERVQEIYSDLEPLQNAFASFPFQWAPGLLEALNSETPPSVLEIKSFDLDILDLSRQWVVYLVIVERRREDGTIETRLYFGSTVAKDGSNSRIQIYLRIKSDNSREISMRVPKEVAAHLREGDWEISQVSIVGATEIPMNTNEAEDYAYNAIRALVISIEATLTINFWTFTSTTMGSVTSQGVWAVSELPYTGLNTHSAFGDMSAVKSSFQLVNTQDLTEAQRESKNAKQQVANMSKEAIDARNARQRVENMSKEAIEARNAGRRDKRKKMSAEALERINAERRAENTSKEAIEARNAGRRDKRKKMSA